MWSKVVANVIFSFVLLTVGVQGFDQDTGRSRVLIIKHPAATQAFTPQAEPIREMVARSAYAQLQYSPLLLMLAVAGLGLVYVTPPLFALLGRGFVQALGIASWTLMAVGFAPTLRYYRMPLLWSAALPAICLIYMAFTIDSAHQHARRGGGMWKGRVPLRT